VAIPAKETMLKIALPNKGRLAEEARELFDDAGLEIRARSERALTASLGGEFEALFVRAQDIPEFVADGAADAGVTGWDLVCESGRELDMMLDLEFGRCRLVVAAREDLGITSLDDLTGTPRVATVFPNVTERFFASRGGRVEIVPMSGSAEIAPHLGIADIIVDLTSTGSTLRVNGLRELATVLESSARLIAAPGLRGEQPDTRVLDSQHPDTRTHSSQYGREVLSNERGTGGSTVKAPAAGIVGWADPSLADPVSRPQNPKSRALNELVTALNSVLRARGQRYVMANVPRATLERVKQVLPGLNGPTVVDILNGRETVAVHAVVAASAIYRTIADLKALGAEGILVTRIERLMP
jgi:ATP phosphoribosyltransferase